MPDPADVNAQLVRARQHFRDVFHRPATLAAAAPGRVNLIGEHTDYNDGYVLPMAIQRQTLVLAAPRRDRTVRFISTTQDQPAIFTADLNLAPGDPKWSNYVRGVVAGCLKAGLEFPGFDALIDSTVPTGGGLSSSAALEVATATLLERLANHPLDPVRKALLCQQADHDFVGVPCGIMDQFISALAQAGHAMLLDCRSHETRMVPLADEGVSVLIANTNVRHELTSGEYALRRSQCETAARLLNVASLRDANLEMLESARKAMDTVLYRRARHVIGEITRTTLAADEMSAGHWTAVGELMFESHRSLLDYYEVSCPELDVMVDLARQETGEGGVYGARMTGGGFGGCTVTLARTDAVERLTRLLHEQYQAHTGIESTLFATQPAAGARIVDG